MDNDVSEKNESDVDELDELPVTVQYTKNESDGEETSASTSFKNVIHYDGFEGLHHYRSLPTYKLKFRSLERSEIDTVKFGSHQCVISSATSEKLAIRTEILNLKRKRMRKNMSVSVSFSFS